MGCGSSHSAPVTPECGENKNRNVARSPSPDATQPDTVVRDGGEGGKQERGGNEDKSNENERINYEKKEIRPQDAGRTEIQRPKSESRKSNGVFTDKRTLNEASSPRVNSGRGKNLAFEVAATDGEDNSLIKRHPPKKFQKLEEQQSDTNITQELLEEKQADAEKRRKEILSKRVKSAKTASAKSVQARARIAESKEVDQLIRDEERELQRPHSDGAHLPPLSSLKYHRIADSSRRSADTDSIHSHSTLSSAASTIVTPQQSAQYHRREQDLRKQFDEEYEMLKQSRMKDMQLV